MGTNTETNGRQRGSCAQKHPRRGTVTRRDKKEWREEDCNKAGKEETQMRDPGMFTVPKQHLMGRKPRQKQQVGNNWLKDTKGNTWETERFLGPKSTQRE